MLLSPAHSDAMVMLPPKTANRTALHDVCHDLRRSGALRFHLPEARSPRVTREGGASDHRTANACGCSAFAGWYHRRVRRAHSRTKARLRGSPERWLRSQRRMPTKCCLHRQWVGSVAAARAPERQARCASARTGAPSALSRERPGEPCHEPHEKKTPPRRGSTEGVVETRRIELPTFALRTRRSPS